MDFSLNIYQLDDVFKHISDDAFMHILSNVSMHISDDAFMHLSDHMETLLYIIGGLVVYSKRPYCI